MNNSLVCVDLYQIKAGDTLYTIADKYDLPISLLMKVNHIKNPYNLRIGEKLCIPGSIDELPNRPVTPELKPTYVVAEGDTLYLIAKKHKVKLNELIKANLNLDPYNLIIGTELIIPTV